MKGIGILWIGHPNSNFKPPGPKNPAFSTSRNLYIDTQKSWLVFWNMFFSPASKNLAWPFWGPPAVRFSGGLIATTPQTLHLSFTPDLLAAHHLATQRGATQTLRGADGETAAPRYHSRVFFSVGFVFHCTISIKLKVDGSLEIVILTLLDVSRVYRLGGSNAVTFLILAAHKLMQTHSRKRRQRNPLINKLEDAHFSYFVRASQVLRLGKGWGWRSMGFWVFSMDGARSPGFAKNDTLYMTKLVKLLWF